MVKGAAFERENEQPSNDPSLDNLQSYRSLFYFNIARGLYFWSEITIVKQSWWTATSYKWLVYTTGIRINILYWENHYCGIEDVKSNCPVWNWTCDLVLHILLLQATLLALFFWLFQCPGVVAEWWIVCTGAPHSGGYLSSDLGWTRPTTCAPFSQTAASHGLDYSTALPVPASKISIYETSTWYLGT